MSLLPPAPKVLIPVVEHLDVRRIAEVAAALGGSAPPKIIVASVVEVSPDRELSSGARAARAARVRLEELAFGLPNPVEPVVRTDRSFGSAIADLAAEEDVGLVLAGWSPTGPRARRAKGRVEAAVGAVTAAHAAQVAVIRLGPADRPARVLAAVRGGPNAELALATGRLVAGWWRVPLVVVHVMPPGLTPEARGQAERSLVEMSGSGEPVDIERVIVEASDVLAAILEATGPEDLLLLGASVPPTPAGDADGTDVALPDPAVRLIGEVPARLMREAAGSVMVVRTREPVEAATFEELTARSGTLPAVDRAAEQVRVTSERVGRWFADSNFHHAEFANLRRLADAKRAQGMRISVILPTLDVEATIGPIVRLAREELVDHWGLVDELLVVDSGSSDRTREIAAAEGATVVQHPEVLPQYGSVAGRGEALWKGLYMTAGELVAWADTDVPDWHPRLVYGTLGPLLLQPRIQYVKSYHQRPVVEGGELTKGGAGAVTELVARPMINLLYPELSGFIQPLAGESAARRTTLERIPFFTGPALGIGHLIDVYQLAGLDALGQVDLERRVERERELEGLSRTSFVVLQAILKRLESGRRASLFAELGSRMKLPRSGRDELLLEIIEVGDLERPPMIGIPEYAARTVATRDRAGTLGA
jgi:hypothetical protein